MHAMRDLQILEKYFIGFFCEVFLNMFMWEIDDLKIFRNIQ